VILGNYAEFYAATTTQCKQNKHRRLPGFDPAHQEPLWGVLIVWPVLCASRGVKRATVSPARTPLGGVAGVASQYLPTE
jgi:hypothetical protein